MSCTKTSLKPIRVLEAHLVNDVLVCNPCFLGRVLSAREMLGAPGISKSGIPPLMNLLRFKGKPIFEQLILEEKLLRRSSENWCIVNDGTNAPSIVSGLSGKLSQLIEVEKVISDGIPVIRRFSGGGTVIVDEGTIFITFICSKDSVHDVQPCPQPIMSWTGQFYKKVLGNTNDFNLNENDYCFGNRKFGGNAQSITKNRWLHHTSFLWDFNTQSMEYLRHPAKERNHLDFLCSMKNILPSRSTFSGSTISTLESYFSVRPIHLEEITMSPSVERACSTKIVTIDELMEAFTSHSIHS